MIGVAVEPTERDAAREFFELCKTPWEFFRTDGRYEVVLSTSELGRSECTRLVLIFSASPTSFDAQNKIALRPRSAGAVLSYAGRRLPIYGAATTFPSSRVGLAVEETTREPALWANLSNGLTVVRIGYNLFVETRILLTSGQPAKNSAIPALELHIALLRDLITRAGLPFVEIPPVPEGHAFTVCLTHDVDHPSLRSHFCDRTMFGFLYRSIVGSLVSVCRGRKPLRTLGRNWVATGMLPLVHLRLAKDPWCEFDRYLAIESGRNSTFFVLPRKGYPGRTDTGSAPSSRACRYELADIVPQLKRIIAAGSEVGLHGIDAWLDAEDGRGERDRVAQTLDAPELGVRMHWLYFDGNSPAVLDQAGFTYDSTVGYNETVGYRAGTTQVYRPLGAENLLELPLHVMDTAMFYPDYLDLGEDEAGRLVDRMMDNAALFGGVLTVNWHDRSIAPERLWEEFYGEMLRKLKFRRAWFPTASQAVAWFRKRRLAVVESPRVEAGMIRVRVRLDQSDTLPGLTIRVHKPRTPDSAEPLAAGPGAEFVDVGFSQTTEQDIAL
jgi:hypothetical protein